MTTPRCARTWSSRTKVHGAGRLPSQCRPRRADLQPAGVVIHRRGRERRWARARAVPGLSRRVIPAKAGSGLQQPKAGHPWSQPDESKGVGPPALPLEIASRLREGEESRSRGSTLGCVDMRAAATGRALASRRSARRGRRRQARRDAPGAWPDLRLARGCPKRSAEYRYATGRRQGALDHSSGAISRASASGRRARHSGRSRSSRTRGACASSRLKCAASPAANDASSISTDVSKLRRKLR